MAKYVKIEMPRYQLKIIEKLVGEAFLADEGEPDGIQLEYADIMSRIAQVLEDQ